MSNFIKNCLEQLNKKNFQYPDVEMRSLLNKTSKTKEEIIFSNFNENQINMKMFKKAFRRRLNFEPLAKIFNEKYFWKNKFYVNNDVLDPRPETELIIESVKKYIENKNKKINILDLGTGSGCLAISLAQEYLNSKIVATDISIKALKVAIKNSKLLTKSKQIEFIHCNWIKDVNFFDVIVANPPYLNRDQYNNLPNEILSYEPKIALYAGKDGLFCYRKIANILKMISKSNTLIFIEIGHSQKNQCINLFREFGMNCIEIIKDYQNYDRILVLKKLNKR